MPLLIETFPCENMVGFLQGTFSVFIQKADRQKVLGILKVANVRGRNRTILGSLFPTFVSTALSVQMELDIYEYYMYVFF